MVKWRTYKEHFETQINYEDKNTEMYIYISDNGYPNQKEVGWEVRASLSRNKGDLLIYESKCTIVLEKNINIEKLKTKCIKKAKQMFEKLQKNKEKEICKLKTIIKQLEQEK